MEKESIKKGAKKDKMRIKIRSMTVASVALVILLSTSRQAAADSYADMLSNISTMNQRFWDQQNSYNQWLSNQGTRALADRLPVTQQQSFAALLAGHTWQVRSAGLACQGLIAVFH